MDNLLIVHGGAPTAVLNSSLYGIIEEARKSKKIDKVYGAIGGDAGLMQEHLYDLLQIPETETAKLLTTPGSSIGTSRYAHSDADWDYMAEIFEKYSIKYVLMQGGNGTMNTCGHIVNACGKRGIKVVGLPKTVDNDLAGIDHAPGFASAANFVSSTVREIGRDVESLPIHVCVIETMGWNAGWLAAASALARKEEGDAPHLIYLPERRFNMEWFLEDVEIIYKKQGWAVVVCSEGLIGLDGNLLVPPVYSAGRAVYPSLVGNHLANTVTKELGIKTRYEKAGLGERSSIARQSTIDRDEAIEIGRLAVRAVLDGKTNIMIGIERISSSPYKIKYIDVPIENAMMIEKKIPDSWINDRGNDVTDEYIEWCKPLINMPADDYLAINRLYAKEINGL